MTMLATSSTVLATTLRVLLHVLAPAGTALSMTFARAAVRDPTPKTAALALTTWLAGFVAGELSELVCTRILDRQVHANHIASIRSLSAHQSHWSTKLLDGHDVRGCIHARAVLEDRVIRRLLMAVVPLYTIATFSVVTGLVVAALLACAAVAVYVLSGKQVDTSAVSRELKLRTDELEEESRCHRELLPEDIAAADALSARLTRMKVRADLTFFARYAMLFAIGAIASWFTALPFIAAGKYGEYIAIQGELIWVVINVGNIGREVCAYKMQFASTLAALEQLAAKRVSATSDAPNFEAVTISYALPARQLFALHGIEIARHAVTLVVGEEGAGKSTFCKYFADLCDHASLSAKTSPIAFAKVSQHLQQKTELPQQPVSAEAYFGARHIARAKGIAEYLGFGGLIGATISRHHFSGGQARVLALVKALATVKAGTELLILDEPDTGLCAKTAQRIFRGIEVLQSGGSLPTRILYVSHHDCLRDIAQHVLEF